MEIDINAEITRTKYSSDDSRLNNISSDYALAGYRETKSGDCGVIYCKYVPMEIGPEHQDAFERKQRAGKCYATIKDDNPNPYYAGKRGEIVWRRSGLYGEKIGLHIDTSHKKHGHNIWVAMLNSWKNVEFNFSDLTNFEAYDENGDIINI